MVDNKDLVEFHSNVCLVKDKKNHQVIYCKGSLKMDSTNCIFLRLKVV